MEVGPGVYEERKLTRTKNFKNGKELRKTLEEWNCEME